MLSRFRLYSLDNGSLIVVCGKCDFHLVITKELLDETRKHTVLGEPEKEEKIDV